MLVFSFLPSYWLGLKRSADGCRGGSCFNILRRIILSPLISDEERTFSGTSYLFILLISSVDGPSSRIWWFLTGEGLCSVIVGVEGGLSPSSLRLRGLITFFFSSVAPKSKPWP